MWAHDPSPVQPLVSRGLVRLLCARFRLIVRASDPSLVNLVRGMQCGDRRGGHGCGESAQLAGGISCWFWQSCGCKAEACAAIAIEFSPFLLRQDAGDSLPPAFQEPRVRRC
ncbi:hypothetical protein MPTK1_8g12110 [Marchantia polymorpha subsp. ruderalis]|uniref:Uncharacterized protein n=1 Tax=Marchantia polymorpha TaxID=3197 RepID=A0A2R6XM75_MARPO|nr:hypothetical protein MARPO_0008s0005 [Marchantia polymorpha]BBN19614.1 hypothetical protein Mp_8g12110 [Marchantia polymorpha subsp. ruderalis]|eukprot:PTQ47211.1 hypothetical protein MARPO_0008s0005 [Marchantia polymorpha]